MRKIVILILLLSLFGSAAFLPGCQKRDGDAATTPESTTTDGSLSTTEAISPPTGETTPPTEGSEPPNIIEYPMVDIRSCVYHPPTLPFPKEDAPEKEWIAFFLCFTV